MKPLIERSFNFAKSRLGCVLIERSFNFAIVDCRERG